MTSLEYIGHIDDINSEYDMIYMVMEDQASFNQLVVGDGSTLYTCRWYSYTANWKWINDSSYDGIVIRDFNKDVVSINTYLLHHSEVPEMILQISSTKNLVFAKEWISVVLGDALVENKEIKLFLQKWITLLICINF